MTETEKLLLSALESLQRDSEKQQTALLASFKNLQTMYETTRQENHALANHCELLNTQVQHLTAQLTQLSDRVNRLISN